MANSVAKLTIDSQEYDAKLKSASKALSDYFDIAKKGDRTFEVLDDDVMDAVKAIGQMETHTKSATGQLREMETTFRDMSLIYRRFTESEKQSPVGREMAKSLSELKGRLDSTRKDLADINQELSGSKFGQFGGVLDTIGRKLGVTGNLTEILTSKQALMYAGVGAGIAVLGKATEAWVSYNKEIERQDQFTTVTTGLDGTMGTNMTDTMRALSDTYKVDFRQAIEAANTLMSQFGESGDSAIRLIKDGMQGMILGDGGKLLQMIKQYAPAFHDAGVSASQLIAVIHNSEGGIFTAENMNAIVMGIKNIRLMTKQTSNALAKLGIDGKQMTEDLNNGTITVFDALKKVAAELKNVDSNSQTAGEVMQTIFGRQGVTAGTNIAKAIENLNTNLEETKKQTGELGDAFAELQTANENLNVAIRNTFEYDGYEQMATGIKAKLITALADVIEKLGTIKGLIGGITTGQAKRERYGTTGMPEEVRRDLEALQGANESEREQLYMQMRSKYEQRYSNAVRESEQRQKAYDETMESSNWKGFPFVRKFLDRVYDSSHLNTARSNVAAESDVLGMFNAEARKIVYPEDNQKSVKEQISGLKKAINNYDKLISDAMKSGNQQLVEIYEKKKSEYQQELNLLKKRTIITDGSGSGSQKTPQEQAQARFDQAEKDYAQALEQVTLEVESGRLNSVEAKRKELHAEESLWKAIGDAREVYDDPKFAEAQAKVAENVKSLGGSLTTLEEEQKKAQDAAREMAAAQKKVAEALEDAANAYASNDLKAYMASLKKVGADVTPGMDGGNFTYTKNNLQAFTSYLDDKLSMADYGSTLFNNLTAQLADAKALANLMETAVKNGIDIAQFDPQGLFRKIFSDTPGDYVENVDWQSIEDAINEKLKKMGIDPIELNFETGDFITDKKNKDEKSVDGFKQFKTLIGDVSTINGALQQLGIDVPEGFQKTLGVMQVITTIMMSLQSLAAITAGTSALKSIPLVGWFLQNGGVVHAQEGWSGIVPGNSFSGDNIPAFLNSGETVLSAAQSATVANLLTGGSDGGTSDGEVRVESDEIVLTIRNGARRRGMTVADYLGL